MPDKYVPTDWPLGKLTRGIFGFTSPFGVELDKRICAMPMREIRVSGGSLITDNHELVLSSHVAVFKALGLQNAPLISRGNVRERLYGLYGKWRDDAGPSMVEANVFFYRLNQMLQGFRLVVSHVGTLEELAQSVNFKLRLPRGSRLALGLFLVTIMEAIRGVMSTKKVHPLIVSGIKEFLTELDEKFCDEMQHVVSLVSNRKLKDIPEGKTKCWMCGKTKEFKYFRCLSCLACSSCCADDLKCKQCRQIVCDFLPINREKNETSVCPVCLDCIFCCKCWRCVSCNLAQDKEYSGHCSRCGRCHKCCTYACWNASSYSADAINLGALLGVHYSLEGIHAVMKSRKDFEDSGGFKQRLEREMDEVSKQLTRLLYDQSVLACIGEVRHYGARACIGNLLAASNEVILAIGVVLPQVFRAVANGRDAAYKNARVYDDKELLELSCLCFLAPDRWDGGFGGVAWGAIAKNALEFRLGTISQAEFVEKAITLVHNGGSFIFKPTGLFHSPPGQKLYAILNRKFEGMLPEYDYPPVLVNPAQKKLIEEAEGFGLLKRVGDAVQLLPEAVWGVRYTPIVYDTTRKLKGLPSLDTVEKVISNNKIPLSHYYDRLKAIGKEYKNFRN